ncbi:biodegradative arginine decarboxylase [Escherichia coli]|uniref:Biodegradative arginine decarboxylase n=1 Tax=Escherichia coli TaxID=562 RepID=A0A377CD68_ECOLX|nr:biodegradative arginine decarboxylase [Escherichia coli]
MVTNCTYDGVCYNAKEAQDLLEKTSDRLHFDEAWYGYARFNPIYADHYAMRGETWRSQRSYRFPPPTPPTNC